ncbi:hypothetical protein DRO03_10000, partial [Methanosarcinales archaeon]
MIVDPYNVPYQAIYAVGNADNSLVEIIEFSSCYGGSAWARHHYRKSPLVLEAKVIGNTIRYLCKTGECDLVLEASRAAAGIKSVIVHDDEIRITYAGLGGGGVGATTCR